MTVIGCVLIVVGIVLFVLRASARKKFLALASTETFTASALQSLYERVSKDLGKGAFRHPVEVTGRIECDAPLTADISKEKCVAFSSEVDWEYEETVYEENPQTRQQVAKTRRSTETISRNSRSTPFRVKDQTGGIQVDPEGAEIEMQQVVDRLEPDTRAQFQQGSLTLGGRSWSLLPSFQQIPQGRRTLGFRYRERIHPLNRPVFVLGMATDAQGEVMIARPVQSGASFLVSSKCEEELTAGARSGIRNFTIGGSVCFALGAALVLAGLVFH